MILGLSHIGMTVASADASIEWYTQQLDFRLESDAERKGPAVEAVTGIKGFHTRTVYLSASSRQHLEVFEFYYPPVLERAPTEVIEPGILRAVLSGLPLAELKVTARTCNGEDPGVKLCSVLSRNANLCSSQRVTVRDPDGMLLELSTVPDDKKAKRGLGPPSVYATVVSQDWSTSLEFYESVLGLERSSTVSGGLWSALLRGPQGTCLEVLHRPDLIPRPSSWRMEQVGFTHLAFAVADLSDCYQILLRKKVRFRSDPQEIRVGPHAGGRNVYADAPDGIVVELIGSPLVDRQWATRSNIQLKHVRDSFSVETGRYPNERPSG